MEIKVRRQPGVSDIFAQQIDALWQKTPVQARSYVGRHGWRVRAEIIDLEDDGIETQACVYAHGRKQIVYFQYFQSPRGACQNSIDMLVHYHELGHVVREQCRMHAGKLIKAGRGDELCRFYDYRTAFEHDYARLRQADIDEHGYFLSQDRLETKPIGCDRYEWAHEKVVEESYCELFGEHAANRGGPLTELLPTAAAIVHDDIRRILPSLSPQPVARFPGWPETRSAAYALG